MDKDIVVIGSGSRAIGVVSALGLTGQAIRGDTQMFADEFKDFDGDTMILSPCKQAEEHTPRRTGVAKDRRLARKKRAQKLARRR